MIVGDRIKLLTAIILGLVIGGVLLGGGYLLHVKRPSKDDRPSAMEVRATGKCAECHANITKSVVHLYEKSRHAQVGVSCFDCHKAQEGQQVKEHNGFMISTSLTSKNCASCHPAEYKQFEASRHAGASWGAVNGIEGFSPEQIIVSEKWHAGSVKRPAHPLLALEGGAATESGCNTCHAIGKPNADGSFGHCTECHSKHDASVSLAREPTTCGQCHMGPDHSQLEIYEESRHGIMFAAHRGEMNLKAPSKTLSVNDMPIPTCSTCHMSGLEGSQVTHNVSNRLSYWLFAPISEKRPGFDQNRAAMQAICANCHTSTSITSVYAKADKVVEATNEKVKEANAIYEKLKAKNPGAPFSSELDFLAFDLWHYYGRTAKHGAFMGGSDYVQWHGNYEILRHLNKLKELENAKP